MGTPSTIWQKVALRDAGPVELDGDGLDVPVDGVVATAAADALARAVSGHRVIASRLDGQEWAYPAFGVLASGRAKSGHRLVATDPHIVAVGAFGILGMAGTPIVMHEAWSRGRLSVGVPRGVHLHINGPVPTHLSPMDLALHLVSEVGFDGLADAVIEARGDAVDGMPPHARADLLAGLSLTGCLTALCGLDASAAAAATRLGTPTQLSLAELAQHRADETAVYQELLILNADDAQPRLADLATGRVEPTEAYEGKHLQRVIIGGCVGGALESIRIVADMLEELPPNPAVDVTIVPGSRRILQALDADGTRAKLEAVGARLLPPTALDAANGVGLRLAASDCLDPRALIAGVPSLVASAHEGRIRSPKGLI